MTTTEPATPEATLDQLLQVLTWEPFIGPTGAFLWRAPGSKGGTYTVSDVSCTCPADTYHRGVPCKHRQALALYRRVVLGYLGHVQTYRRLAGEHYTSKEPPNEHDRSASPPAAVAQRATRSAG